MVYYLHNSITPVVEVGNASASANREEKLLCHIAMVAKFLDDTKQKLNSKGEFALF